MSFSRSRRGPKTWRFRIAAVLTGAVCAHVPFMAHSQHPWSLGCGLEAGPERAVAAVLDGETVRLDDGKEVRLVAMLAPRASDVRATRGQWPPEETTRAALAELLLGRTVALAFAGRREDRFSYVLAHIFVHDGAGGLVWVQGRLVEQGLARASASPGNDACIAHLVDRERTARAESRGLWANSAYTVRPADRPTELARYQGRWELVRGTVEAVSGTQSLVFVDLVSGEDPTRSSAHGERPRRVRLTWRRSIEKFIGLAAPARTLRGRDVLVRGWVELRGGSPEIEILAAGQIEVLPQHRQVSKNHSTPEAKEKRPEEEPPGVEE